MADYEKEELTKTITEWVTFQLSLIPPSLIPLSAAVTSSELLGDQ